MTASDPGMTADEIRRAVLEKLFCMQAKFPEVANRIEAAAAAR